MNCKNSLNRWRPRLFKVDMVWMVLTRKIKNKSEKKELFRNSSKSKRKRSSNYSKNREKRKKKCSLFKEIIQVFNKKLKV